MRQNFIGKPRFYAKIEVSVKKTHSSLDFLVDFE